MQAIWDWMAQLNPIWQGLSGGVIITLLNLVGALLILVWRKPSVKALDTALGFAAGVMLTARPEAIRDMPNSPAAGTGGGGSRRSLLERRSAVRPT